MNTNRRGRGRGRNPTRGGRSRQTKRKQNNLKMGKIGRIVPLGYNFQPPRLEDIIRYNDVLITNISASSFNDQIYRINNIYDPDFTGTGRVGYGYEQLSLLYNSYLVTKIKWNVEIPSINGVMLYCVVPVNGLTTFADINFPSECPFSKIGTTGLNGSPPFRDIRSKNLWTLTGVPFEKYISDDVYRGTIGSTVNPVEVMQLHICSYNPTISTLQRTVMIKLEYTTIWYDPILPQPTTRKTVKEMKEIHDDKEKIKNLEEKINELSKIISVLTVSSTEKEESDSDENDEKGTETSQSHETKE